MTSDTRNRKSDSMTSDIRNRTSDNMTSDVSVNRDSSSLNNSETGNSIGDHVTEQQNLPYNNNNNSSEERMSFNRFQPSTQYRQSRSFSSPVRGSSSMTFQPNSSFLHNNNISNGGGSFVPNCDRRSDEMSFQHQDYNREVSAAFSNYQSHVSSGVFSQSFESVDRSPKLESLDEMESWNSFCQTPSLTEAILETDKYLVSSNSNIVSSNSNIVSSNSSL